MSYESLPGAYTSRCKDGRRHQWNECRLGGSLKTFQVLEEWKFWTEFTIVASSFLPPLTDSLPEIFTNPSMENLTDLPRTRDCGRRAKVCVWALWVGNQQSKTFAGPKKVFETKLDQFKILQKPPVQLVQKKIISRFVKSYGIFLATWHRSCGTPFPKKWWTWTKSPICRSICCNPCLRIIECTSMNSSRSGCSAMLVEVTSIHSHSISMVATLHGFRWFWCVLVLFFDIDIGLYSHSIGLSEISHAFAKSLATFANVSIHRKEVQMSAPGMPGWQEEHHCIKLRCNSWFELFPTKGCSTVGLWESECNMDVSRIQGRHQREVQQNSSDLGVIALVT